MVKLTSAAIDTGSIQFVNDINLPARFRLLVTVSFLALFSLLLFFFRQRLLDFQYRSVAVATWSWCRPFLWRGLKDIEFLGIALRLARPQSLFLGSRRAMVGGTTASWSRVLPATRCRCRCTRRAIRGRSVDARSTQWFLSVSVVEDEIILYAGLITNPRSQECGNAQMEYETYE